MKRLIRHPAGARSESPFMVIWEVTQACDLVCLHCRASAQPEHHPKELSFDEGCRLIDQVCDFGSPRPLFVFTGGDPFKRDDLFDLVSYARSQGLVPGVSPSATPLVTKARLAQLHQAGAKVISLSLDASTAAAHDHFRGVEGSFQRTLDAWREAREVGLKVQINSTVNRRNLEDLAQLAELIAEGQVMTWSLFFLVPTGRASVDDAITPEECEAVMHFLADLAPYLNIKTTEGHHYKRVLLSRAIAANVDHDLTQGLNPVYGRLKRRFDRYLERTGLTSKVAVRRTPMHISSGSGFVFVSHLGEVFPSGFLPMAAGNVRQSPLTKLYRESDLFVWLRQLERLRGRCGGCEFREVCGGSRSRAFAVHGDPFAEDPLCGYQPGSFPHRAALEEWLETTQAKPNSSLAGLRAPDSPGSVEKEKALPRSCRESAATGQR